jgi:hypothetical protein
MILVTLTIPLNYILAKQMGINGPALADLITFSIYNGIRCVYLYRKYGFQPFNSATGYTLLAGVFLYLGCTWLFGSSSGLVWMIIRSVTFITLYGGIVLLLRLSADVIPVWNTVKKRLGLGVEETR